MLPTVLILPPAVAPILRCPWAEASDLLRAFHDHEWGEPVQEANILFEYLILHTFQLGFNFPVVLKYREVMRELLAGFEPARLARFGEAEITALLTNPRMLRSRRKLEAAIQNAQAWLRLRQEVGGSEANVLAFVYAYAILSIHRLYLHPRALR
jgi:DNA-3-methyladenine glycosylase I